MCYGHLGDLVWTGVSRMETCLSQYSYISQRVVFVSRLVMAY